MLLFAKLVKLGNGLGTVSEERCCWAAGARIGLGPELTTAGDGCFVLLGITLPIPGVFCTFVALVAIGDGVADTLLACAVLTTDTGAGEAFVLFGAGATFFGTVVCVGGTVNDGGITGFGLATVLVVVLLLPPAFDAERDSIISPLGTGLPPLPGM